MIQRYAHLSPDHKMQALSVLDSICTNKHQVTLSDSEKQQNGTNRVQFMYNNKLENLECDIKPSLQIV